MLVWKNLSACALAAATTDGSLCPKFATPIPQAKSKNVFPSTSVIVAPSARSATIGVV